MFRQVSIVFFSLPVIAHSAVAATYRVDSNATSTPHDGSSWAQAFLTVQDALANPLLTSGDEVWVADGTYTPVSESASFELELGVKIFGGFDGGATNEQNLFDRDFHKFEAILSGELGTASADDNCWHVVRAGPSIDDSDPIAPQIDGFTIIGGYADGTAAGQSNGGGMYLENKGKVIVANIIFENNHAHGNGGALFVNSDGEINHNIAIVNCTFIDNDADNGGGAWVAGRIEQVTNCAFAANVASFEGGGLGNDSGSTIIVSQCSFSKNDAGAANTGRGSGLYCAPGLEYCDELDNFVTTPDSTADIRNCIIWGNGHGPELFDAWVTTNQTDAFFESPWCHDGCCGGRYWAGTSEPIYLYNQQQVIQRGLDVRITVPLIVVTDCQFTTCQYAIGHFAEMVEETWFHSFTASATLFDCGPDPYALRGYVRKVRWRDSCISNDYNKAIVRLWSTTDGIIQNCRLTGGQLWLGGTTCDYDNCPCPETVSNLTFKDCTFLFHDDGEYPADPCLRCNPPRIRAMMRELYCFTDGLIM